MTSDNSPLTTHGRAVKSYIHISDVSHGELTVLEMGRLGERYHISPDNGVPVREVVRMLTKAMRRTLAEVSEDVAERPGQDAAYVIDSAKLRDETGWRPMVAINEGLQEVVRWVNENWSGIQGEKLQYLHKP